MAGVILGYMIGKVVRGNSAGGLLRYLYGPGRANEHVGPHLVGSWDMEAASLEPPLKDGSGGRDFARLTGLLEHPLGLARHPDKPIWHCPLRVAPKDRSLTDAEWAEVAREVVHRTGFAPKEDDGGCRWVAVRHADDHIHLVVTLARQDGRRVSTSNDFYRLGEACRWAEQRFGLTFTAARDRTAAKRPSRAETEKASRRGRPEPTRLRLQREVRTVAAAAGDQAAFLEQLQAAGLLVRPRFSTMNPDEITGYSVALPGDHSSASQPIWFGGGKLAPDLSWTKLARRWSGSSDHKPTGERLRGTARSAAWARATRAASDGADAVRRLAISDPGAAADAAHATADALYATARVVEGRRGGPLTDAASAYDRAGRELWGRTPPRGRTGDGIRAAARLLTLTGRASRDESTQLLQLVTQLIALTEAVGRLRDAQGRATQASAARKAAEHLRSVAPASRPVATTGQKRRSTAARGCEPITLRSRG